MQDNATPWSMTFDAPIEGDALALALELLGHPAAHDRQTFLFDSIARVTQIALTCISTRVGHAPALALYHVADIVALGDGELYRATQYGWQRVRKS
jgi:hypothetical protein